MSQRRDYIREWRSNHPNYMREYQRKYRADHLEQCREYEQNRNKEHRKEYIRKYCQTHRKQIRIRWKRYKERNLEKVRKIAREGARQRRKLVRLEIFSLLGNKCSNPNCLVPNGCSDSRCLQIDHVRGGGSGNDKKARNRPSTFYLKILKEIKAGSKDYQLLCSNCNWIKRFENHEV